MHPLLWLAGSGALTFLGVALFVRPVAQSPGYHCFADRRRLLRAIPNTLDVLSNLAFIAVGVAGVVVMLRMDVAVATEARGATMLFFIGTVLTGIGSTIYHLDPHDRTLVYDRLGMTVAFMSFLAMLIHDRFGAIPALLPSLVAIGAASIVWWRVRGDLRFYGWVQFFPILALVVMLVTTPARYTGEGAALWSVIAAYAVAKVFERGDRRIYELTRRIVSGHTLKHFAAALAPLIVLVWIVTRAPR